MAETAADLFRLAYGREPDASVTEKLDFVRPAMTSSGLPFDDLCPRSADLPDSDLGAL